MAIKAIITHKNDSNLYKNSYTPSFSNVSENGNIGAEGNLGKSLYFTNYDLNNDYYKDIVIKKISNNMPLSSDADIKLEHRHYINGDLILTNTKMMYMISLKDDTCDIKLLGKLQDKNITEDYKDNILSVNLNIEYSSIKTPLISNRSLDSSIDINGVPATKNIEDCDNTLYCLNINPIIELSNVDDYNNYMFYLRIKLYNKKTISEGEYYFIKGISDNENVPNMTNDNNTIEFYKTIEFLLNKRNDTESTTYVISDMSMDKLHPSGNNIDIKITNKLNDELYSVNIIYDDGEYIMDISNENNISEIINKAKNAINTSLEHSHTYIQYPREIDLYGNYRYNFRAGESAYFSGMTPPKSTGLQYSVNEYHKIIKDTKYGYRDYVCEHMLNFLLSPNNKFELICVNTKTNWSEIIDLNSSTNIKMIINKKNESEI